MFQNWKNDVMSSIVVFLVALPLCLGIALASNAPLSAGLFAGILGGIVIGSLSGSQVSVSGPAAGLTVIVINGIAQLGGFETFALAVLVAGVFQIVFGLLKGGAIGNYFPTSVIRGMLAAIGLILILKQYPVALGLPKGWTFSEIPSLINPGIITISILCLTLMLGWDKLAVSGNRFFKLVPGALVAVVLSVGINLFFQLAFPQWALGSEDLVQLPFNGGFSEIFSMLKFPDFSKLADGTVITLGLTIAIVASLETLLCVDAADKLDPEKRITSKDRELFAQGMGNAIAGLVGALPLTAVIVRTSANIGAGAKSKLSAIFHGVWLLLCIVAIPKLLNFIPLASLACILLLTGYKLCKPTHFKDMKRRGWDQLFIFCTTIIAILGTDLLKGIFIGIGVTFLFELNKLKMNPFTIKHESEESVLEFTHNVSFLHKERIHKALSSFPRNKPVHIKGMSTVIVHVDVVEVIMEHKEDFDKEKILVKVS